MKTQCTAFLTAPLLFMAACSNPADNVPAATVSSNTNAAQTAAGSPASDARSFAFDESNSKIEFIGSKVTGSHNGGFTNFAGELKVAAGTIVPAGNRVVIDTTSLWSDNGRLTGHLKNPDFFDVAKFPTAVFETTAIEKNSTNHTVSGNLTLHGITKQISFPANIQVSDDQVKLGAEFFINRFDFEMKYGGKADDLIRQEVVLKLDVTAKPGNADFAPLQKSPAQSTSSAGQ